MNGRRAAVLGALLLVGVATGIGLGRLADGEPVTMPAAAPVPGESPSYPSDPAEEVKPDPDSPALASRLPLRTVQVGGETFPLDVPVPEGWRAEQSSPSTWHFLPPGQPRLFSFAIRVQVTDSGFQTADAAREQRLLAMAASDDITELQLESETDDTFVASYVANAHRRVTMERFVAPRRGGIGFAVIAVVGRERDRTGLRDLFDRIGEGLER